MAYEDLLKDTSVSIENNNYFLLTIPDLTQNSPYPIQLRWKYNDGLFSKWSAAKLLSIPVAPAPNTPSTPTVDFTQPGIIKVTWNGNSDDASALIGIDRVDIYIDGAPFDGTKPTDNFKSAGTKLIPAPAGTYTVALYAVDKLKGLSPVSGDVTGTVVAAGEVIQTPTSPTGITASTIPFGLSVNWAGTYASSSFTGFKAINIYASATDLGSTATTGISSSNLVGSLTVNDTVNRINVGLDNLKQAMSLANNTAAYTTDTYLYYITVNKNDELYKVSGTATYTRINSTALRPTQANYVDLASGVISIENLVAGNGTFGSWLRTGSAGGARIELSAVTDFTNNSYTVQKGLVAYSSGSVEVFNLDIDAGTLTINGGGTFTGSLSVGSSNAIFKAEPATGIWLGNATYASAPFSVSNNGVLKAASGTIGGWTLGGSYLTNASDTFRIQSVTDPLNSKYKVGMILGATTSPYLEITADGIIHRSSDGSASGKFSLTTGASGALSMTGAISGGSITGTSISGGTITGADFITQNYLSSLNGTGGIAITDSSGIQLILFRLRSAGETYTSYFSLTDQGVGIDGPSNISGPRTQQIQMATTGFSAIASNGIQLTLQEATGTTPSASDAGSYAQLSSSTGSITKGLRNSIAINSAGAPTAGSTATSTYREGDVILVY